MRDYKLNNMGTIRDFEDWFLVQQDCESVSKNLQVEHILREEGLRGCLINEESLNKGDYELKDVVWFSGTVPHLDKVVYQIELSESQSAYKNLNGFLQLYYCILEDFEIDSGDLSIEVFEVQYWNKFEGDSGAIYEKLLKEFGE